jgi:hypothetical protein
MWFKFILMLSCLYDKKFVIPQNAIRFVFIFVWSWGLPLSYNFKFLPICNFISNFNIFHLMSQIESYCQYQNGTDSYWKLLLTVSGTDSHTENYRSLFQELTHILKINAHCFRNWLILKIIAHCFRNWLILKMIAHCFRNWLTYWKLMLTVSGTDSHTENYRSLFQELTHILKIISHCFRNWLTYWKLSVTVSSNTKWHYR